MATLNITYNGRSEDVPSTLAFDTPDDLIKQVAAEIHRLSAQAFEFYVVDRFDTAQGGQRIYLRPKVPFGSN